MTAALSRGVKCGRNRTPGTQVVLRKKVRAWLERIPSEDRVVIRKVLSGDPSVSTKRVRQIVNHKKHGLQGDPRKYLLGELANLK